MTRPILTLKKPVEPEPEQAKAKPAKKTRSARAREAVSFLAGLRLPLFEHMQETAVLVPMAVGIREEILARVDPALRSKVVAALKGIAHAPGYGDALHAEGARRRRLDGSDAGPVSDKHARRAG
jgi:hypothetical protein